jgi:hypothetical protein
MPAKFDMVRKEMITGPFWFPPGNAERRGSMKFGLTHVAIDHQAMPSAMMPANMA